MDITGMLSQKIQGEHEKNKLVSLSAPPAGNTLSFSQLVKQVGGSAVNALNHSQQLATQAALGTNVDSQTVALGVLNASSGIRQLTGIMAAVTQSYKEIERMQI